MDLKDLKAGMRGITVQGKVVEMTEPREVVVRKTGKKIKLAVATLQDQTDKAKLVLWGDQIEEVSEGNKVIVDNGYTKTFRGNLQIHVGRRGNLKVE